MARGYTTRKLEVWSIHARQGDAPIGDYGELFAVLANMAPTQRIWETEDKAVAVPSLERHGNLVRLTAYEGPRGQPIIFDTGEATERTQPLKPDEIVATKTHVLIDIRSREAIIEYNHRGAKATDIAIVLGVSARRNSGWEGTFIDFSPKVDRSFVEGVDAFERIRVAGFRISRPNTDWTDWDNELARSALDSGAQSAQAEYTAPRGDSLAHNSGVIPFIRARAADGVAALKSAFVTGRRSGEAAETTITTGDHKEHQRVAVRLNVDRQVDEQDIDRRLAEYHDARQATQENDHGQDA